MSGLFFISWFSEFCVGWEVWGGVELDKEGWILEDWVLKSRYS